MRQDAFWRFFDKEAGPRLGLRGPTFRKMFEYLDRLDGPITIVETGCARQAGNWQGDGQSTVLFDRYVTARDAQSSCVTVDISEASVAACRALVGPRVSVNQDDSVAFLGKFVDKAVEAGQTIDLLYLDSFDLDRTYWYPSAIHHLKELTAAIRCLGPSSLVAVDDCPLGADLVPAGKGNFEFIAEPSIGGKGRLVAEYAATVGARLEFCGYQAGWTGLVRNMRRSPPAAAGIRSP